MRTLCTLLVNDEKIHELHVWADLPPISPSANNEVEISLLVGEQEQNWRVCKAVHVGFPHGQDSPAPYTHIFTKPVMLPRDEARNLVKEILENFPLLQ